jgi:Cyclophilin type peptidyl-prolyl cis-trans isomerase/CLD
MLPLLFFALLSIVYCLDPEPKTTHYVTFDVEIGDKPAGQLKIHLFHEVAPKTVKNFYLLSKGTVVQGKNRSYTGSIFHRIIKSFMIQGGDITKG